MQPGWRIGVSKGNRARYRLSLLVSAAVLVIGVGAQTDGGIAAQAPAQVSAQSQAPFDLTGYWVSVITEDWRWRMVTPPRGDYASVPLNPAGRKLADAWNPVRDTAEGNACKAYGAAGIMRIPTRLRISWQDPNTLKIETDAGQQTRILRFAESRPPRTGDAGWQGYSSAVWELAGGDGRRGGGGAAPRFGTLKIDTVRMRPGYLRKNGVPYSETATMTEYLDLQREPNGDEWLVVTSVVREPKYLTEDFVTSPHFKREADGSKWRPAPCTAN
jgi:hypothetical protein